MLRINVLASRMESMKVHNFHWERQFEDVKVVSSGTLSAP